MNVLWVSIRDEDGFVDFAFSCDEEVFHGTLPHEHGGGDRECAFGLVEFDHSDLVAAPAEWDDAGLNGRLRRRWRGSLSWRSSLCGGFRLRI